MSQKISLGFLLIIEMDLGFTQGFLVQYKYNFPLVPQNLTEQVSTVLVIYLGFVLYAICKAMFLLG